MPPLIFTVWELIVPSNTVDLARGLTAGLWVGALGDVAAVMQNGTVVVFAAVPAGTWLPLAVRRINSTGTSATGVVALYR
jgi:hypothetical protein